MESLPARQWHERLDELLNWAKGQEVAARGGPDTERNSPEYFYWAGYRETVAEILDGTIADVASAIQEATETQALQERRLPVRSSPRQFLQGRLDALHRVDILVREEKGEIGGPG